MTAGERLYLSDDTGLGVTGNPDLAVCARHVARYEKAIALADTTNGVWLDFACGSGYGTALIADVAELAVGMDRDPIAIRYAVRNHDHPNCIYRVATFDKVWGIMGHYLQPDVVLCIETLEHLDSAAQGYYMQAVARGMAPGGVFVLACPIGNGPSANPWHVHEPSKEFLIGLLRANFRDASLELEDYMSTSGPAVQAWAVCR